MKETQGAFRQAVTRANSLAPDKEIMQVVHDQMVRAKEIWRQLRRELDLYRRPEVEALFAKLDRLERINSQLEAIDEAIDVFAAILERLREVDAASPTPASRMIAKGMSPAMATFFAVVAKSPALSTRELCGRLDLANLPVPEEWRDTFGVEDWKGAYAHPKLKARINTKISKSRRAIRD